MTKRVLSLLLTLVMVLSLGAPAFAADEFEAEAPAEVVEEAPAAPVEPEAPEAEEVVEEPVAEEPVEEPEVAAAIAVEEESADEPLLVKLGIVTKEAHWELYKAIQKADKLLPDVQNGKLRAKDFDSKALSGVDLEKYAADAVKNDPFVNATGDTAKKEDFESVLAEAKKYLTGIDGADVDVDVTSGNVEKAAEALEAFVEVGGDHQLVDDITTGTITNMTLNNLASLLISKGIASVSGSGLTFDVDDLADIDFDVTDDEDWAATYQANYRTELQKAIKAYQDLAAAYEVKYADFVAAAKAALSALTLEAGASKPNSDDLKRVKDALAAAPQEEKDYSADKYVLGQLWATYKDGALAGVKALLPDGTIETTEFKGGTKLWQVNAALEKLENALTPVGATTIAIKSTNGFINDAAAGTVTLSVKYFPDSVKTTEKIDGHRYGIAWQFAEDKNADPVWFTNGAAGSTVKDKACPADYIESLLNGDACEFGEGKTEWALSTDGKTWELAGAISHPARGSGVTFKTGNIVTIHLYEDKGTASFPNWVEIGEPKTIEIKASEASTAEWPKFTAVYVQDNSNAFEVGALGTQKLISDDTSSLYEYDKTTGDLKGETEKNAQVNVSCASGTNLNTAAAPYKDYDIWFALLVDGKTVATSGKLTGTITTGPVVLTLSAEADAKLKAGKYTVELRSCAAGQMDQSGDRVYDAHTTAKVEIKSLRDGWTSAYIANAKAVIAEAEKLKDVDYKVTTTGKDYLAGSTEAEQIAGAFGLIKSAITDVKALLSDKTAGNTMTNHNKIGANDNSGVHSLGDILKVCSYLEKKDADVTELNALLAQAAELVGYDKNPNTENEGTGKYTFDTRGRVQDAIEVGKPLNVKTAYQSKVNAAVDELKAAIAGLKELDAVDKTALEASVKAAEALKESDYTAATWAAVEAALKTAKDVLAKTNPTQAELTNAAEVLTKAVEALVKTPAAEKAEAQEKLDAAVEKAEALNAADYTAESMKAVTDAVAAAEKLAATATAADIEAAAKAIEDAIAKLEKAPSTPVQPEIPAAPASGTGWVHAKDGTWYYYKDKALQKSKWIYGKGGLWYYVGPDGAMWTGFRKIGNAYFMLQTGTEGGVQGKLLSGWINDPAIPGKDAYARTDRNSGHFGEITWTAANGDFVNGHFTKGDPAA